MQDTWSRESVAGDCCNLSIYIKYAFSDYKYLCAAINDGDFWDLTLNSAANLSDWLGSWQKQRDQRSLALTLRKSQAADYNGTWWSLNECTWPPQSDEASTASDQRGKCQIVSLYFLSFTLPSGPWHSATCTVLFPSSFPEHGKLLTINSGPLHTRAKSRDHVICKSPKESVQRPSQHTSKIMYCSVKSYVTGPSTKCYFNEFLFCGVLTHDKIE